jgi:hypothetical protein
MPLRPRTVRIAVYGSFLLWLGGCATPYQPFPKGWNPPPGVALPIRARVSLESDPKWCEPDRQIQTQQMDILGVHDRREAVTNGGIIRSLAWKVFRRIFTEVGFGASGCDPALTIWPSVRDPAVTIVLRGNSSNIDGWWLHKSNASVTATVFAGEDTSTAPLATFTGEGAIQQALYTALTSRVTEAYEGAIRQVAYNLLADPQVLAAIQAKASERSH